MTENVYTSEAYRLELANACEMHIDTFLCMYSSLSLLEDGRLREVANKYDICENDRHDVIMSICKCKHTKMPNDSREYMISCLCKHYELESQQEVIRSLNKVELFRAFMVLNKDFL